MEEIKMNYSTDRPIDTCEQDLLGRASFSKQLGRAIYDYNGKDGLVIGLYGKWGSGKTSVINMAVNEMITLAKQENNMPLVMKFAPWNYSDKDNLISIFFQSLKNKIELQDNEELKKEVGKALNDYAGAFDALSLIPIVGSGVAAILKTVAQAQGTNLMQGADLEKTKELLESALVEVNKKIVIIIDDIDRLTNSQIRDVFQLVKQVADFPNIIYILAMDREVVRRALQEVHNVDGNEYLQKIIQVPFEIPELRKSKLNSIFFSRLDEVVKEISDKIKWDDMYWKDVFQNCIEPYINTLRDVNRVINTFQFKYGAMYEETAFEDMIGITTIEVLDPELYKWIGNNKEAVCGGFFHGLSFDKSDKDYRKKYSEEFLSLEINPDRAIRCIAAMFPMFANDVNEKGFEYFSSSDIRSKMRAAHKERFELYFMYDLDDIRIPRNIINACIYKLDTESIRNHLDKINKQGNIIYFLDEVRSLINNIPYKRLGLIASIFLEMQGNFHGQNSKSIFTISANDIAERCIDDMINRLKTEAERFKIIYTAVKNLNSLNFGTMARRINRIELAYGRLAGKSEKEEGKIISLNHLREIEELYVSRIHDIVKKIPFVNIKGFKFVFYLWKSFEKEGAKNYINKMFEDDVNKIRFVCILADKWNGTNGCGWSFNPKTYSEYISDEEIFNLIQDYDKSMLQIFSREEQIKMASFVLRYGKNEMFDVHEQEAMKLIEEWKDSIDI
ncbi:AAA family ATPase [Lachnospiraceae bacterium AM23-7LB]|nr:AAA family ATPase [Lachnospiraceae bacterium AM23-7LB]RHV59115.1 AAA family ATPase [Lachnospiraceae bacterium OM02-26]